MSQDLKLETFKADILRFDYRMRGIQISIEKIISQWQIARISA
jgi:hypothetical protein